MEAYGEPYTIPLPVLWEIGRYLSWKLPYKSTVVAAILPQPSTEAYTNMPVEVVGYLCVDSGSAFAFRKYDVELVRNVAENLYPIISRYQNIAARRRRSNQ